MAEQTRPPVVTILGHVDHGKTSLLDFIRKTSVASKEHGGITQAIGAYQVENNGKLITFIDTPGHAAFEKMRSRGAKVADMAILVVAADDGVMPQTIEAIKHIQTAGIPMIVAVSKVDLPGVNVKVQTEKIKRQLSDQKVLFEEYGGDVPIALISAKTGEGVKELLEIINLTAEIHGLMGDPESLASGVVIEARLDRRRGPVATVLVRDGSLRKGDTLVLGGIRGKVRGMFDWEGKPIEIAGPSQPVEVLGLESVPEVGSKVGETKEGKLEEERLKGEGLLEKLREEKSKCLNVVIKADNQGSLEAIEDLIASLNREESHIKIISSGTGEIIDSDIEIADVTKSIVVGFDVKVVPSAQKRAETDHILIRIYNVIYELMEELEDVVKGILKPQKLEEVFGRAQIIAEFPYGKNEKIAGCKVIAGTISKGPKVRIVREETVVGETKIKSLKKVKEEVSKVEKGDECGVIFNTLIDFQIGDIVESFRFF